MKKLTSLFAILLSTQLIHAHPGAHEHTHTSFFSEWGWIIIPVVLIVVLLWKFSQKKSTNRVK